MHVEHRDAGVAVRGDAVLHEAGVADERHAVDELLGYERSRRLAIAAEVRVLDRVRFLLEAIPPEHLVVEVLVPRAHAAEVQRERGAGVVAQVVDVVTDRKCTTGDDVERREIGGAGGGTGRE